MNLHKMRKIKQIFAVCLSLALVCGMLCALPLTVTAAQSGTCGDNLTWTLDDNGLLTISGTGEMQDCNNYTDQPWRDCCDKIIAIQIDDGVTSIGDLAFCWLGALTSITIPDSVTSIGRGAFESCNALDNIEIPGRVASIGDYAFYTCHALSNVIISEGVTSIGGYAFAYCNALTSITIPASVTSIGMSAFGGCSSLESIQVNENNSNYTNVDGVLYNKDKTQLVFCPMWKSEVEILDSVTSIGDYAFYRCKALTEIMIPDSVTSIGYRAFLECTSLTNITLPDSVRSIGEEAFEYCFALESVAFSAGVTSIGNYAFYRCEALTEIMLPASVTNIGLVPFYKCTALERIQVDVNNTEYSSVGGALYSKDETKLLCYPAGKSEIEFSGSVTSIGERAFEGCRVCASMAIPNGVTSIGEYAFSACDLLTSITLPGSVTSIGWGAFMQCDALESVTISEGVTSIPEGAFEFCGALTSITLPESVTSIGKEAFLRCDALESITIPASVTNIGIYAFTDCDTLTIYGFSGSYAQEYANANHIPFVAGTMIADKFFTDVVPNAWYVDALKYAVDNNLFNGIAEDKFAPDMAMNRGMLVTVLWRAEGEPSVEGENPFDDVAADKYYADAVLWASANDIVNGMSEGVFDPERAITREQMATILYRYAQYKGYDVSNTGDLNDFPDGSSTSDYAATALAWAYGEGLITGVKVGDTDYLDPQGGATRAQVATIFMRYQNTIAQ